MTRPIQILSSKIPAVPRSRQYVGGTRGIELALAIVVFVLVLVLDFVLAIVGIRLPLASSLAAIGHPSELVVVSELGPCTGPWSRSRAPPA